MTESEAVLMVTEWMREFRSAREEARFARNYAPDFCIGRAIFGPVVWDMSLERDTAFDRAYLELQRRGYR